MARKFQGTIHIFIKPAVLNPEEGPVAKRLQQLGFESVAGIKMGKCHIVSFEADDEEAARQQLTAMCEKLLMNPITEQFEIETLVDKSERSPISPAAVRL
jgi:phosphoribosylformylglycinamidine synthase PurS subunit